jgi:uncharacterized membrane protein (DUF4010 family)
MLIGAGLTLWSARRSGGTAVPEQSRGSPLRLSLAIQMALAFQLSMLAIDWVRAHWALPGLYATAAFLGLTDVDALTVSMSRMPENLGAEIGARAIAVGIVANSLFKSLVAATLGSAAFRWRTAAGLLVMAAATAVALAIL